MPGTFGFPTTLQGEILNQQMVDPAAGAQFSVVIPAGEVWRVTCVQARLIASAAAANRTVNALAFFGATTFWLTANNGVQAAAESVDYSFAIDCPTLAKVGHGATFVQCEPLPENLSLAAWTLRIEVLNVQAADQLTNIVVIYQKWRG